MDADENPYASPRADEQADTVDPDASAKRNSRYGLMWSTYVIAWLAASWCVGFGSVPTTWVIGGAAVIAFVASVTSVIAAISVMRLGRGWDIAGGIFCLWCGAWAPGFGVALVWLRMS